MQYKCLTIYFSYDIICNELYNVSNSITSFLQIFNIFPPNDYLKKRIFKMEVDL